MPVGCPRRTLRPTRRSRPLTHHRKDTITFNGYATRALLTARYPDKGHNLLYPALGLAGETGETVDKIKKLWRNVGITSGVALSPDDKLGLMLELGDVLWYAAALAYEMGVTLEDVAKLNIAKLADRNARGVIQSEGDNR